jgi:serine protease
MALPSFSRLGALLLAITVAGCEKTPTGPSGGPLVLGQSVRIQGQSGSVKTFTVEVPSGTGSLLIQALAGSGDADMYVTFGAAPPPTGPFDCYSESFSDDEECHIDDPAAGTWYISIVGYTSYSGVDLVASLGTGTGAIALQNAITVADIAGTPNSARLYSIIVPEGATQLGVEIIGPNGDADLYVRRGAPPTLVSYSCASAESNSEELCTVGLPAAGRWYILIDGYAAYTGLSLTATVTAGAVQRE